MKKLLILIMCISLILCLVACKNNDGKDSNTNTNTNTNTDTSTDTGTDTGVAQTTYKITVKNQDGTLISGAVLTILDSDNEIVSEHTTDENGVATIVIKVGDPNKLSVLTLPEYTIYEDGAITLGEETEIELLVKNTEPNGTQDRPYALEDSNEFSIPAGATVYYILYGGSNRNFALSGANGVTVNFGGEEKAVSDDGTLEFKIPVIDEFSRVTSVVFTNTTSENATLTLTITSDPGASDNPFELTTGTTYEHVLEKEKTIYYKWVADKTGYVVFYSESSANNVTMYNLTTYVVTSQTNGALCDYIWANEGDEVMFYISSKNENNFNEVNFSVNCYAGTEQDPIPVYEPAKMLSLKPSQALTFVSACEGDHEVIIEGEGVKLIALGDIEFTPDQNGLISGWVIGNGVKFVIENTTDEKQEFVISLEK